MSERRVNYDASAGEEVTLYGFDWNGLVVERTASFLHKGQLWRMLTLRMDTEAPLTIYVSPTGRSMRVFRRGKELK